MVIRNHIAYRFLSDDRLWMEMLETTYPNLLKDFESCGQVPNEAKDLYYCLSKDDNKPYAVTESVTEFLDMLKVTKKDKHYNWAVFNNLPNQKVTFIFQDGSLLRMIVSDETIWFMKLNFKRAEGSKEEGYSSWVMFYIKRKTMELCTHFEHQDVISIEEQVYKFLCFFYLTENTEEIIPPGRAHGTRKTGKTLNDFRFPLTIVTSKWNVTSIRNEEFGVRGHFRIQPCGTGRMNYEIIFISPFKKHGYVRKAKSLDERI